MDASGQHHFLVLEDDALVARPLARIVHRHGVAHVAASVSSAMELLDQQPVWRALLLDVLLPDGNGLDLLARFRTKHPAVPAMILTGYVDERVVNTAFDLRPAYVVAKPWRGDRIESFLCSLIQHGTAGDIHAFAVRHHLSVSESDILRRLIAGELVDEIARARGTSVLTVRKQIASLRLRTGDESTRSLIIRALSGNHSA